jgi:hypothetical protein
MTASVTVPAPTAPGNYTVTFQASTAGAPAALSTDFTVNVTANPDFILTEPSSFPEVNFGSSGTTGPISIASQDGFSGTVTLSCPPTFGANSCSISPTSVSSFPATATLTINGTSFAVGTYSLALTGVSASVTHSISVPFDVGDYTISGTETLSLAPGGQGVANLTLTSSTFYSGKINATCDAGALTGATCTLSPANPLTITATTPAHLTATINVPNTAANGQYNMVINTHDTTGAPNHSFTVALTVTQDFSLTVSPLTQTVIAPGQLSGAYNLTVQPAGSSFNGSVALSCPKGLPPGAQCVFSPSTLNSLPQDSILNIATSGSSSALSSRNRYYFFAVSLSLFAIMVMRGNANRNRRQRPLAESVQPAILLLCLLGLLSCAGVSNVGGGGGNPTPPGTYMITVTGTSSAAPTDSGQSKTVTLVVN